MIVYMTSHTVNCISMLKLIFTNEHKDSLLSETSHKYLFSSTYEFRVRIQYFLAESHVLDP